MNNKIVFQGEMGAYSHIACVKKYPDMLHIPVQTFEDAFFQVKDGNVKYAMIPIDNSLAGRVADIHHLLLERMHLQKFGQVHVAYLDIFLHMQYVNKHPFRPEKQFYYSFN